MAGAGQLLASTQGLTRAPNIALAHFRVDVPGEVNSSYLYESSMASLPTRPYCPVAVTPQPT
jgi:hypothetical protein